MLCLYKCGCLQGSALFWQQKRTRLVGKSGFIEAVHAVVQAEFYKLLSSVKSVAPVRRARMKQNMSYDERSRRIASRKASLYNSWSLTNSSTRSSVASSLLRAAIGSISPYFTYLPKTWASSACKRVGAAISSFSNKRFALIYSAGKRIARRPCVAADML